MQMFKITKAPFLGLFISPYDTVISNLHLMVCNILKINITDFDYHNGRLCFECDQQLSPDNCDQVTLCDQDRVSLNNTNNTIQKWHIMPVLSFIVNTVYLPTDYLFRSNVIFFFNLIINYISFEFLFYYHCKYYYHYYNHVLFIR